MNLRQWMQAYCLGTSSDLNPTKLLSLENTSHEAKTHQGWFRLKVQTYLKFVIC